MKHIDKLFPLIPGLKAIAEDEDPSDISAVSLGFLSDNIPEFNKIFREALDAYSTQGFFASPQVNSTKHPRTKFFDWSTITLVRRTNITPTDHQILIIDTYRFVIQYLITGGFKNNVEYNVDSLPSEFKESKSFIDNAMGVKTAP